MTEVETACGIARYGCTFHRQINIDLATAALRHQPNSLLRERIHQEDPGVVVTLIPSAEWRELAGADDGDGSESKVWGVVYTIEPGRAEEVQAYLDEREKDGYEVMEVDVFVLDQDQGQERCAGKASVYVGHTTNPSFYKPTTLDQLAAQIHKSVGPSGPNKEYLYLLKQQVEDLCPPANDPYLANLEGLVKQLDLPARP